MRLTEFSSGGGCGCKLAARALRDVLLEAGIFSAALPPAAGADATATESRLLVGAQSADDAAVWRLNDQQAIIATTDFFSPVVDTPADFGKIAATNALSDVYAMGGTPLFALALAAMPPSLPPEIVAQIFAGGREQCALSGALIAGGHTIEAKEPLYGLAVIGQAHPDEIVTNAGAKNGDVLLLGKPLGIGVLAAALRRGELSAEAYAALLQHTTQLNSAGRALAQARKVHALTDVTGFGLLGHLAEMCRAANLGARLTFADIPLIAAAVTHAKDGVSSGGATRNRRDVQTLTGDMEQLEEWQKILLTDPQTSGGLLAACARADVAAVQGIFNAHGQQAAVIGEMTDSGSIEIRA